MPQPHDTPHDDPRWQLVQEEFAGAGWYQRWEIEHEDGTVHVMEADHVNPRARTSTPPEGAHRTVVIR
jgi:hypothetical protein